LRTRERSAVSANKIARIIEKIKRNFSKPRFVWKPEATSKPPNAPPHTQHLIVGAILRL
jgi:hypothetical protein